MVAFFMQYWAEIILSIVTAGAVGFSKYIWKKKKKYKAIIEQAESDRESDLLDDKLEPIKQEIEDLRTYIRNTENREQHHMSLIIASYRYRLIQLCKCYLKQRYMTQDQYDQLTEFYKLYTALGGNGQAKDYYERTIRLPIKHDN